MKLEENALLSKLSFMLHLYSLIDASSQYGNVVFKEVIGILIRYYLAPFQNCLNSINLPGILPLGATGGAQIACSDPTAPSSWYLDAQVSILGILPQM